MYSVLYVDDENSLLELGKLFLEDTGEFQVETAISASCGLEILSIRSFDAIVSDYQMPGMDGIVFLKEIRSRHGDLPFILFTGKGREEVVIQAINNGANFYLQKGGEPESQFAELGHKIQQAIQRKRAEDALRINEERLSMAQAIGGIGSWEFDPVTKILWGSPEAFRIFGYPSSKDGTIRLDEVGVCIPERERVRHALENLIENGEEYNLEYDIIPVDASGKKILHSVGHLYRDASGTAVKVSGVIQDITVRKKFEEQIIRERENFHKILSTAPVGLLLINKDYVITQANQYIASIVFREPAEIIGKRAGGGIGCVHSTEDPRGCGFSTSCPECPLRKGIELVLKEGNSLNGAVIDLPLLIHGKPEHRWLSVNIEPVELENAQYTIVSVDDITAHMEYEEERIRKSDELNAAYEQIAATEEELRQNYNELAAGQQLLQAGREYLQSIVQGSPIPTFVIDNEHHITSWNQALEDYLGISAALVIGKPLAGQAFYKANRPSLADLIVDQAFDEIPKWYEGKFAPSQKINGAYEVTDFFPTMKGGTWLFFTASPIYDNAGNLIGAVETLQDITERKRAEDKLSRTNEELGAAYEELAATEEELRQNLDEMSITQSDLLESEVRFRSAMNHLPGTAWAVDRDLTYTLSQGSGLSLIGLKPDQVVGMTLYEFFSTSDPSHPVISQHLRALSGESIVYDYTHEGVSFRTYLSPLFDAHGSIAGVNGLAFDITEQLQADEERRRSEEWFRNIFNRSPIAIELYNNEGALIDVNPACCALFGIQSAAAVKGFNLFDDPNIPLNQRELLKTGSTLQYESDFDFDLVKKLNLYSTTRSGKIVLDILVTPIQEKECITTGYLVQIIDITERKRAATALQESFETFRTVMDSLDALVYVADIKSHELLFVNQYGRKTWGDITGKVCWKSLQNNQDGPCSFCTNGKLVDSAGNPTGILTWEFQNSITRRWYECRDSAIQWIDGRIVRLEIATDITERKKEEEALKQANRQLKLLSGITRHDILNQVTVCLGYLGVIKKKFHDPALGEYLGKIESTTTAIRSQIEFTRVYQDLGTHEPQWQRLDSMLPRSQIPATITLKGDVAGIEVYADSMLGKVFSNLLDNSIRHGEHVSEIRVSASQSDNGMTIAWEDNGIGIPADEKEKIFERGFGKNTGLGLYLSREILSITGITIREIGAPGKGAHFEITVPKGTYRFSDV